MYQPLDSKTKEIKKVTKAFITLLLCLSCNNDDATKRKPHERENKTNTTEQLYGKWNWVKSGF